MILYLGNLALIVSKNNLVDELPNNDISMMAGFGNWSDNCSIVGIRKHLPTKIDQLLVGEL